MMRRSIAAAFSSIALCVAGASAKPPTLTGLFPAGAERGKTVTVTASGSFDHWPARCAVEGAGVSARAAEEKGKLTIEVAADARPGLHWLRIHDEEGATNLRPFIVGVLPEAMEAEPNDDPRRPQKIDGAGAVVNGRLARKGDVDGYAVELEKGRTLAADLEANRRLGSPMDAVLQVASADGFVLAQNDDAAGRDPRIIFEAPARGTFIVRLFAFPSTPDSTIRFAGGDDYIYRLTLTTGGFVEHAFPLAASRENPAPVAAVGPNLSGADASLPVPPDDGADRVALAHPFFPGDAEIRRVPGAAEVETEPNDPASPQPISDRGFVSGRIDPPGDRDAYRIALKKGDKRAFRLESRAFGLPLDAVLQVLGPDGASLAEVDDVRKAADPEVKFTAPSDGEFRVIVRDLYRRGGPHHAYLLGVIAPEPDFVATLPADKVDVKPGEAAKIVVAIDRKEGYAEAIEVAAEGLPERATATTALSKPGDASAKSVTIEVRTEPGASSGSFRVVAKPADGKGPPRAVPAKIAGFDAETDRPWLAVLPAPEPKKP